jgi:hypothetical protein
LTLRAGAPMGYLDEPSAFLLHLVDDGSCVSHVVPVSHASSLIGAY